MKKKSSSTKRIHGKHTKLGLTSMKITVSYRVTDMVSEKEVRHSECCISSKYIKLKIDIQYAMQKISELLNLCCFSVSTACL